MSLRVWLPLTKDLRNQGLDDVTITNNGATFNSAGKLGGCYSFNDNYIQTNYNFYPGTNDFSVSCWFYLTENTNKTYQHICSFKTTAANSAGIAMIYNRSQQKFLWSTADGSKAQEIWSADTFPTSTIYNTWHHLVMVRDKNDAKHGYFYLNGIRKELASVPTILNITTNANTMKIGSCGQLYSTYYWTGKLNDFRLYDHALSQMEVKELAKGLILHYPLNRQGFGQENLITQAMIDADPWKSAISGNYTIDGKTGWILSNNILYSKSGSGANNIFSGLTYEANTQYTISFKWRDDYRTDGKSSSLYIRFKYSDGTYSQVISSKDYNYWKEEVMTSTAGKTVTAITTTYGNGGHLLFTDLKLEKGTIKTSTSPIVNSDLYNSIGLNSNIEYDTSGYCNNGARTGTFTWTSDTPKYAVSQYFNGSSYIKTDAGTFSWFNFDKCTIAIWMKPTTVPSSWAGTFGIAHDNSSTNKSFVVGNYGGKFTVQSANGSWVNIQSSDLPINEWHHCVATLDGTTVKMYIDGELVKTETTSWGTTTVATDTRVQVGIDLPGSNEVYQGYYSDARIYATALSADDVKSLYQNCATIDPDGTIRGQIRS